MFVSPSAAINSLQLVTESAAQYHHMTSVAGATTDLSGSVSPDTAPSSMSVAEATAPPGIVSPNTTAPPSERPSVEVRAKV